MTADGRSFTKDELASLMKGVITMNAHTITKVQNKNEQEKSPKLVLIKALQATAFKNFSGYMRILSILRGLAEDNDRDAEQAVQEIADILKIFCQHEQVITKDKPRF